MKYRIALYDYGVKYNIERELQKRGCEVVTIPALTPPEEVAGKFDGVMLSNGPGDPAENVEIIENLKRLLETNIPIFGICLGHQLLSLAIGAKTTKLKYGHRGVNHPVKDLDADRTYITSQTTATRSSATRSIPRSPACAMSTSTTARSRAWSTSAARCSPCSTTPRSARARWIRPICLTSSLKISKMQREVLSNAAAQGYSQGNGTGLRPDRHRPGGRV